MIAINSPRFKPGQVVASPGALEAMARTNQSVWEFLSRHLAADWGVVDDDDKALNDEALEDGSRLLSAYLLSDDTKIWIITEAEDDSGDRLATTILLPDEY